MLKLKLKLKLNTNSLQLFMALVLSRRLDAACRPSSAASSASSASAPVLPHQCFRTSVSAPVLLGKGKNPVRKHWVWGYFYQKRHGGGLGGALTFGVAIVLNWDNPGCRPSR